MRTLHFKTHTCGKCNVCGTDPPSTVWYRKSI